MKTEKINVLVTGCGGDIGQSIGKILKEITYIGNFYGCDISDKNAAKFIFPEFFISEKCSDPSYLSFLESFVVKNHINLVIPVSEPELRFFAKNKIKRIAGAVVVLASENALDIGFDKLETAKFLEKERLPFPETYSVNDLKLNQNFPVILKSRTGSGSSAVTIARDKEAIETAQRLQPDFIVQEYLSGDSGEFTCGLFRSGNGIFRNIIIKRELMGGFTGYGEVVANEEIEYLLRSIAEKLNLVGSINVQLRITSKGPVVFEINPRFSSTVRFRHLLGFKDLEWSIEENLNEPISDYNNDVVGKKIYKGFNEYIQ